MTGKKGRIGDGARDVARRSLAIAMAVVLMLGNVLGMIAPVAAYADGSYTHVFPNGGTVQVHPDGSITGDCVMRNNRLEGSDREFVSDVTMPDGMVLTAGCYEVYISAPNHDKYPAPCAGTYPFTATRQQDGTYFVLIHSQDAAAGAPGTVPSTYPYQRSYIKSWSATLSVDVEFTKVSADAKITDGNSEYAYSGATYEIYDAATNSYVTTITTDDQGHASYKLAPNKSYYAIETKAPLGFQVNPNRIPFDTGNTGSAERLPDDPGTVRLTIKKKDSATLGEAQPGATLDGAEYKIVSLSTPGWEATGTTNSDGKLAIHPVPFGKIVVTEIKAPKGYKLDPTPHEYEVKPTGITDVGVIELTPEDDFIEHVIAFDLDLVKYKDTGSEGSGLQDPAEGVRFDIVSNTTGETVGTITTDENGHASTAGEWFGQGSRPDAVKGALPYDAKGYTVKEDPSSTPEGYRPCPPWQVTPEQMADGTTLHYIVDNDFVSSRIQIVKTDAGSGQNVPLAGFTFQLLDEGKKPITQDVWYPNHAELSEFTTDDSGRVTLPGALKPGTYYIREVAAAAPYLLNGEDVKVVIENDPGLAPITVVRVADEQARGKATIRKECANEDCPWHDDGKGLEGAEFDVMSMDDIVSPDGAVQAVAGEVVDHVATDDDGTAETKELPLGAGEARYAFVETKAPAGHQLDSTPVEFTLSWADDETEVVFAEATAKDAPTETIVDKTIMGTDHPLTGAEFDLWPAFLEMGSVSGVEGKGSVSMRFEGISGHEDEARSASISLSQRINHALISVKVPDGFTFSVKNGQGAVIPMADDAVEVAPGTYTIEVRGRDGEPIDLGDKESIDLDEGKSYRAEYGEGVIGWGAGLDVSASDIESARYDESDFQLDEDIASIDGIEPGTYELSVKGYGEDAKAVIEVEPGKRAFAIASRDGGLSMAMHMLEPGIQPVFDKMLANFGIGLTTGDDGRIVIDHLPARQGDLLAMMERAAGDHIPDALADAIAAGGDSQVAWRIQETDAPAGFLVDPEVRTFTIHDDGTIEGEASHHIHVEDDYTKVDVSKRDITNEAEVEGAKLTITDSDGNIIDSWVSGREPHRVNALDPGTYTLTEEMTPHGYDKAQSVEFTVRSTGEVQTVVMHDEPIRITGEIDKRQEIADPTAEGHEANGDLQNRADVTVSDDGSYDYSLDYRSTSSTWVDEFTVEDSLDAASDGLAVLTGITTAQGSKDYDGLMNVWFTTNQTPADHIDGSGANATLSDGHENPWLADDSNVETLGDDGRAIDYTGWRLWREGVSTTEATELKVSDLGLAEGEVITGIRFEHGRVEEGFTTRTGDWDRTDIKSGHDDLDDVQATHKGEDFELPDRSAVTIRDADGKPVDEIAMEDSELASHEDGDGYLISHEGETVFVPFEDVKPIDGGQVPYAPAVVHMRVTDAYVAGTQLDNSAKVDLYRNGGGDGLEDHDDDFVTQVPKKVVSEKPVTPGKDLDQTGGNQMLWAVLLLGAGAGAAGLYAHRRRALADGAEAPDDDPDGHGPDGNGEAQPGDGPDKPGDETVDGDTADDDTDIGDEPGDESSGSE